jgi:hypothetical protein
LASICTIAEWVGLRPTYCAASSAEFCPASRGIRKKIANVIMLTTTSRKTVETRRRMMNEIMVCVGQRPAGPRGTAVAVTGAAAGRCSLL